MDQSSTDLRPSDTTSGVENVENGGTGDNFGQRSSGDTNTTQMETKVIYHIDEEETPYKVTVST